MIGCGLSSSMRKALSLGSKSYPGTVAKARSSGEKSSSIFCRLSSFSLSALARFDSAYRKDFSSFTSTRGLAIEGRIQIGFDQGPDLLPVVGLMMAMLVFSSFFSTLGLVMMLIEVKVSPVEAKMDALGIDILSTTFSSGLGDHLLSLHLIQIIIKFFTLIFPPKP